MKARVISRDVFVRSPERGTAVHGASYYATASGVELMSLHGYERRSDVLDVSFVRRSHDNGRTWSDAVEVPTRYDHPEGTFRRSLAIVEVERRTGRLLCIWNEAVFPTDDPLEGMRQYTLRYGVSEDGGRTFPVDQQIIHEGAGYDAIHHLPGVTVGKTCAMIGDSGQRPLTRSDGAVLVPIQVTPAGPDGEYRNPGAGYTYTDCTLLFGRWRADGRIAWTASERIVGEPDRTTRGLIEPTIAELADGSLIMVMRGSNDARPHLPGHKWIARSRDGGGTWTRPEPWTYLDGEPFFSPSSMSQLVPYSDGHLFWVGNVCAGNPAGNSPRYPIIIGEVDRERGLLVRESVAVIDDRAPGESPHLTLSNFYVREDRATAHLVLHMTRLFAQDFRREGAIDWTADALVYRIAVPEGTRHG